MVIQALALIDEGPIENNVVLVSMVDYVLWYVTQLLTALHCSRGEFVNVPCSQLFRDFFVIDLCPVWVLSEMLFIPLHKHSGCLMRQEILPP